MTEENKTEKPKKSMKKIVAGAIAILISLFCLNHFTAKIGYAEEQPALDSLSVVDSTKADTSKVDTSKAVMAVDTTKKDTLKK